VVKQQDAAAIIVQSLRDDTAGRYGYDLYLPTIVSNYVRTQNLDPERQQGHQLRQELSTVFLDAAWELARRGIIRPGVREFGQQSTDDGSAGNGFSVTPFGQQWLTEASETWVPTEPERFAEMLAPFTSHFGPAFHGRAQEAIRCYGAHAYFACCAMCGAAAESILLATAIVRDGDETRVLQMYMSSKGRSKLENMLVGSAREPIRREFQGFTTLLKYWRDAASHGEATAITENEAYTALAMLLRFAQFTTDNWSELTAG